MSANGVTDQQRHIKMLERLAWMKAQIHAMIRLHQDDGYTCECKRMRTRNGEPCILCEADNHRKNATAG